MSCKGFHRGKGSLEGFTEGFSQKGVLRRRPEARPPPRTQFVSRKVSKICKDTKEYLNQKGTKIRVFSSVLSGPFPPTLFLLFPPFFPFQALLTLPPLLRSSPPPLSPLF